jgi:hypothetical protein
MAADRTVLHLNGFGLQVQPSVFTAYPRPMPDPDELKACATALPARWFTSRPVGPWISSPISASPQQPPPNKLSIG